MTVGVMAKETKEFTLDEKIDMHLKEYETTIQTIFKEKNYFKIIADGTDIIELMLGLRLSNENSINQTSIIKLALKTNIIPRKTKNSLFEIDHITEEINEETVTYKDTHSFLKSFKKFLLSFDNTNINEANNCIELIESLPASEPPEENQQEKNEYINKINESLKNLEKHLNLISKENYAGAVIEGYNSCKLMLELFLKNEGYELKNGVVVSDDEIPVIEFCTLEGMFPKECNEFLNTIEEYKNNFFKLSNSYELALSFLNGLSYFLLWFNNYYSEKYSIDQPFKIENCYLAINKLTRSSEEKVIFKIKHSETKKQKSEIINSDINNPAINFSNGLGKLDPRDITLLKAAMGEIAAEIYNNISEEIHNATEPIKKNTEQIITTLDDIKEEIKNISMKITDYQSLISRQIKKFDNDEEKDRLISAFADLCAERIINETNSFKDDDSYNSEKIQLVNSLGNGAWSKLSEKSKTCLISSKLMFNNLNDMEGMLDYSGVCILITKALEVELYKRFYENFFNYLDEKYNHNYKKYPTGLLYNNKWPLNKDKFNLGTMAYILCLKPENPTYYQAKNNEEKLIEYCESDLFNEDKTEEIEKLIKKFGEEIENIRKNYRNPSAHRDNITKDDADKCLKIVIFRKDNLLKEMLDSFRK